jgi:hypothetical protein
MFSPGTPISSTNKTDRHDKTEILMKVAFKHHSTLWYYYHLIVISVSKDSNIYKKAQVGRNNFYVLLTHVDYDEAHYLSICVSNVFEYIFVVYV